MDSKQLRQNKAKVIQSKIKDSENKTADTEIYLACHYVLIFDSVIQIVKYFQGQ